MGALNIQSIEVRPYSLPFASPASATYGPTRRGRLIGLTSADGYTGWGDAAPLPGFSSDSIDDIDRALRTGIEDPPPSLRFALEQASLSIRGQRESQLPPWVIDPEPNVNAELAGLVSEPPQQAPKACRALADRGFRTLKVKVAGWGRQNAAVVGAILAELDAGTRIRLDANRSWSLDDARAFLDVAAAPQIEFVEEPLRDPALLPKLGADSPVPIALDETIVESNPPFRWQDADFAEYLVLKPTLLGGIERLLEIARAASELGRKPVLSAAFESGLGMLWLLSLAANPVFKTAAGLDTYRFLAEDVLSPRLNLGPIVDLGLTHRAHETPEVT